MTLSIEVTVNLNQIKILTCYPTSLCNIKHDTFGVYVTNRVKILSCVSL